MYYNYGQRISFCANVPPTCVLHLYFDPKCFHGNGVSIVYRYIYTVLSLAMAQVAAGRRSVGSKLKASRTSAGDQLFRTQSTEALLGELFQGLLQQQRRRSSGGPGARSESRGEKAAETALVAGVDAEITKVKRLHMLNVHCLPICIICVWSILVP